MRMLLHQGAPVAQRLARGLTLFFFKVIIRRISFAKIRLVGSLLFLLNFVLDEAVDVENEVEGDESEPLRVRRILSVLCAHVTS